MSLKLFTPDPNEAAPRRVFLKLTCDTCGAWEIWVIEGYMAQRRAAAADGWVVGAEAVFCPRHDQKSERTATERGPRLL